MKQLILLAILATTINACIPPIKPIAPIGCEDGNAILITTEDDTCQWVWIGCN